jgi:hypothetical protein
MRYFLLLMMVVLFGCHKPEKKSVAEKLATPAAKAYYSSKQKQYQQESIADSLHLDNMLNAALLYADKHKAEVKFKKKLVRWSDSLGANANVLLNYGHLFSADKKHLIVTRHVWGNMTYINVFELQNSRFVKVNNQYKEGCDFIRYLIKDVNGDGQKDFLTHWYPTSGCCRRDVYDVYLYLQKQEAFTGQYEFVNPTFSPSEKIIRGVDYGQPGETGLYKYKWNGLKVDSVEYIFPDIKGGKYYIGKTRDYHHDSKVISAVPAEYRHIESYGWFKGEY